MSTIDAMKYIKGLDREQISLFPSSLDAVIDEDNEVRIIDLFVESIDLKKIGFKLNHIDNGRPAYHPKVLLKLFIYGYMNSIRSSRKLEKETKINIEVMWLLNQLSPDHNTISSFRKDNSKAIKKVFRYTVEISKNFDLIGGKLLAGDSTKLRAQNSKKNNYNEKKIKRHINYIDEKVETYYKELSENDGDNKEIIENEIQKHLKRKDEYLEIQKQLEETGESQISTSDPDSRHLITRNNITEVAYNIQTTVDSENNIILDYKVTNENDKKAMGGMLRRAKTILRDNNFTALYDKGYHTGSEFEIAAKLGIDVLVAIPKVAANAPNTAYNVEHFKYINDGDYYICPQGKKLDSTGTWHKAKTYSFKRYTTKECLSCKVKRECSKAKYGKGIQRSEYQEYINNNKSRIDKHKDYYRKRQAIVEHPYGTIKRQWGFSYIMTKKFITRAEADMGLIFSAYNLRRLINILGIKVLGDYLRALALIFHSLFMALRLKTSHFKATYYFGRFSLILPRLS